MRPRNKRPSRQRGGVHSLSPAQKQEVAHQITRALVRSREHKYAEQGQSITTANAFAFASLTAIPQAVSDTDRIGDSLELVGTLNLKYSVTRNATATTLSEKVRVVLFQWFPVDSSTPNGVPPTAAQIFISDPSAGGITYRSALSHDYGPNGANPQFRVFYDVTHNLIGIATLPTEKYSVFIQKRIKVASLRKKLQFVSGGTTGSNMLYLATITDAAALQAVIGFTIEINYTDS